MKPSYAVTTLALLVCAVLKQRAAGAAGDILNLGTFGSSSVAYDMSNAGFVAGEGHLPNGNHHAFRFEPDGQGGGMLRDLGTLGGSNSIAWAINNRGQVAGSANIATEGSHAFRYHGVPGQAGTMHDLGTLGGSWSNGRGINDLGQVVGNSALAGNLTSHAFLYDGTPGAGGVMRDLGVLSGATGSVGSSATDINNAGQISGTSAHAFRYDGVPGAGGVMRDLGTLGGTDSGGTAINASGQVTGNSSLANGSRHAFRYDGTPGIDGVMRDLGTLGGRDSLGEGINDAGYVVGDSSYGQSSNLATLWRPDGSIVDLDAWLTSVNPAAAAYWTLSHAVGITNSGMIAGTGVYNDGPGGISDGVRAFVLDGSSLVPEPTVAPMLIALLSVALARKRN